jgi:BlaI family penicillinase repressor
LFRDATITKEFVTDSLLEGIEMSRRPSTSPTEAELEILNVLWDAGPATVRQVNNRIRRLKPTGYSTTLKLMQIMLGKGLVRRDESVRPQVYSPAVTRDRAQRRMVAEMLDKAFDGSASRLVVQALSAKKATPDELEEIRRAIRRYEEKQR